MTTLNKKLLSQGEAEINKQTDKIAQAIDMIKSVNQFVDKNTCENPLTTELDTLDKIADQLHMSLSGMLMDLQDKFPGESIQLHGVDTFLNDDLNPDGTSQPSS